MWFAMNHVMTLAELKAWAPGFDWDAFLGEIGYDKQPKIKVKSDTAVRDIAKLFARNAGGRSPVVHAVPRARRLVELAVRRMGGSAFRFSWTQADGYRRSAARSSWKPSVP